MKGGRKGKARTWEATTQQPMIITIGEKTTRNNDKEYNQESRIRKSKEGKERKSKEARNEGINK